MFQTLENRRTKTSVLSRPADVPDFRKKEN
jgi:hypothetical protein